MICFGAQRYVIPCYIEPKDVFIYAGANSARHYEANSTRYYEANSTRHYEANSTRYYEANSTRYYEANSTRYYEANSTRYYGRNSIGYLPPFNLSSSSDACSQSSIVSSCCFLSLPWRS